MKLIGNGLLARSFLNSQLPEDCVIIASGVSNSLEQRACEFEREANLIQDTIQKNPEVKIVYFSTTSVLQLHKTPYTKHKLAMEGLIAAGAKYFHIFRLPQLVGIVKNSTLISFFVESIIQGRKLSLQSQAKRNLVDVEDFVRLAKFLIENNIEQNRIMTVAGRYNVSVLEIVDEIAAILNKEILFEIIEGGEGISLDIGLLESYIRLNDPILFPDYWKAVLRKYVPLLHNQMQAVKI
jgi:hypothetical protein